MCLQDKHAIYINAANKKTFVIDGHTCISLDDKLDTVYAMGTEFSHFQDHEGKSNEEGSNNTRAGKNLFKELKGDLKVGDIEHTCFGHVMVWSDGFLRNFNRQKDNSFWWFGA